MTPDERKMMRDCAAKRRYITIEAWQTDLLACLDALDAMEAEVERLKGVITQHELCHDLHGKVDARAFADGCAAEQRKLYGCAPDADEIAKLKAAGRLAASAIRTRLRASVAGDDPAPSVTNLHWAAEGLEELCR